MPEIPTLSGEMVSSTPITLPETVVQSQSNDAFLPRSGLNMWSGTEWNMINLGLEEPLPTQDVVDEL